MTRAFDDLTHTPLVYLHQSSRLMLVEAQDMDQIANMSSHFDRDGWGSGTLHQYGAFAKATEPS
jgi:hypothetical protein